MYRYNLAAKETLQAANHALHKAITPHTSHLTPHTSHLTPHTSHLMQELFDIHSLEPLKVGNVTKFYAPQKFDSTWEPNWYVRFAH